LAKGLQSLAGMTPTEATIPAPSRRLQILAAVAVTFSACAGTQPEANSDATASNDAALTVCLGSHTLAGIDVSADQPDTDWSEVHKVKTFAYIQAVDGVTSDNPYFARDWKAAKAAGVSRGPYQFFRPGDNATDEANHFVALVRSAGGMDDKDLPPMLDWEVYDDDSGGRVDGSEAAAEAQTWLNIVEAAFHKKPLIYTYVDFFPGYYSLPKSFTQYPLWIANPGASCPTIPAPWTKFAIWQRGEAEVSGVTTDVDVDTFDGDMDQLLALAGVKPPPQSCGGRPTLPDRPSDCGGLKSGEGLGRGESVMSCDGRFELIYQSDGNAVLYSHGLALWASHTNDKNGYLLSMEHEGNLVVYTETGCPLWASDTDHHDGAFLALENGGDLVVYDGKRALWSSGTGGIPAKPTACGAIDPGHGLAPGESIFSCDGHHELIMQTDGNLVLYHVGKGATWASNTHDTPSRYVMMQDDGNLVVYEFGAKPTFATGTHGHDGAYLAVQDDGNLVIYDGSKAIWSSKTEGK
jgi:GH25 family lysozyme M1 (1,4-beta-N-acetylmuramidase)